MKLQVKICGITQTDQAIAIENAGATAIGFICVPGTPRYIAPEQIRLITQQLNVERVGVFLDADIDTIRETVEISNLNVVQLHGKESPEFCQALRSLNVKLIKALRIRSQQDLAQAQNYHAHVDVLLLDAYHPQQAGGTGLTIDWTMLKEFNPTCEWWLAGGLNPENILEALALVTPHGIDLSSGLENAPGDKNLERVHQLFTCLKSYQNEGW
ncbi:MULTISPECIES: phosphoribosylanthranilate isomerase [Leptolyngbya]|uniref:N-(5'-phosphoribosyl)anthranilate isomerase n=1 Tax=Leptolyngbya boryana CZ1 TaxID=3060204 RepID=A0AA96X917_LEPBY|nr:MULTISPECIES: phosphoribosylanthranilate isomerase [Leptolyngbya]MCY6489634.1 phosphoribosylanthranilate isomerase [Leptolyngbya sp. GGD]WNZ47780.1 phosphoribosylanthranilate isomerase [Leptolyngbya boryana CZ1]